jgi:predicted dehydrogenase
MVRVGIIGLGGIARSHCDAIASLDGVEVVAVADLLEENRSEYMEKYNIPRGYTSHTELLQDGDVDAVAVVLGHQLHHQLTVDACNAGKHVLVEKPMAISTQQCDDMVEAIWRASVCRRALRPSHQHAPISRYQLLLRPPASACARRR